MVQISMWSKSPCSSSTLSQNTKNCCIKRMKGNLMVSEYIKPHQQSLGCTKVRPLLTPHKARTLKVSISYCNSARRSSLMTWLFGFGFGFFHGFHGFFTWLFSRTCLKLEIEGSNLKMDNKCLITATYCR